MIETSDLAKFMAVHTKEFILFEYTFNARIKPLFPPLCDKPLEKTRVDAIYLIVENTLIYLPDQLNLTVHSSIPTEIAIRPFDSDEDIEQYFAMAITRYIEDCFGHEIEEMLVSV